jgi:hypothetical protein
MSYSSYIIPLSGKKELNFLLSFLAREEKGRMLILSDETVLLRYKEVLQAARIKQLYITKQSDVLKTSRKIKRDYSLIGALPAGIIDQIRRSQIDLSSFDTIIARIPENGGISFLGDISFVLSHLMSLKTLYIIPSSIQPPLAHPLLKSAGKAPRSIMNFKEKSMAKIPENMLKAIDELVRKTKTDREPEKLVEFKKLFKKTIPLGFRGWVAAYLLKEYMSKDKSLNMPLLEEGVTLFIGIGKNRKVYPKDLIHLFINTGKIERSHIGEIRILDNYAFITVEKKSADRAIEYLNGINYRGRNLTVNYAKQK